MKRSARGARCECTNIRIETIPIHQTTMFGPEMVLYDIAERLVCEDCGEQSVRIPDTEGVIATAAFMRILQPLKLTGKELRFVRKAIGISAKELASALEVTLEAVSRWENDKVPMSPGHEKLLRFVAAAKLRNKAPYIPYDGDEIAQMQLRACRDSNQKSILYLEPQPRTMNSERALGYRQAVGGR